MTPVAMIAIAVLFGAGYQALTTLLGARIAGWFWRADSRGDMEIRFLLAPLLGVLAHALAAGLALAVAPGFLKYLLWVIVFVVALDWRNSLGHIKSSWCQMLLVGLYGLACFAILVSFHFGAARGDNLFWSIYNLTAITPGDSPQALIQGQYLLHGGAVTGLQNFALFDRPFLGGLISLAALGGVGLPLGTTSNVFPDQLAFCYIALWVWLNSTFALAVLAIARWFAPDGRRLVACILVLAAPFLVFNVIGAWPKLFAAYITLCAALLAMKGHWRAAVLVSGVAFFTHGSFLWSHLAMCGVLVLYVAFSSGNLAGRIGNALLLGIMAAAFPAVWFLAEHHFGGATPLRSYYLYGVPVDYGLTHAAGEIAKAFYTSTSPGNMALLPFINIAKGLFPQEMMAWLVSFSYAGAEMDLRRTADALFYTQIYRPLFAFCLTTGCLAILGLRRGLGRSWALALAVMAFYLLPLIPGLGLYRRDDHFILPIMVFAVLPLLIALCIGLGCLTRRGALFVVSLAVCEYALIYWSRYPSVRYAGHFFEYYLWLTLTLLALAYVGVLLYMRRNVMPSATANGATWQSSGSAFQFPVSPSPVVLAAASIVIIAGFFGPYVVATMVADGGFQRYGWNVDLARWDGIEANPSDQGLMHTNLVSTENGAVHREMWINTGQSVVFRDVPTTSATQFVGMARVHPLWSPGIAIEPLIFRVTARGGGRQAVAELRVEGAREQAGEWQTLVLDLSGFAGDSVDIQVRPISARKGVWTLWRDPKVGVKP